jgi:hypothetical protein
MAVNLSNYATVQEVVALQEEILRLNKNQASLLEHFRSLEMNFRILLDYIKKKEFESKEFESKEFETQPVAGMNIDKEDVDEDDDSSESE